MFPIIMEKRYDEISTNILRLLIKFSEHIMSIEENINKLLMNNEFNKNTDFLNFVKHFGLGRFYHFRCQGYMECLVFTKCYSPMSLSYWLNRLVYPAAEHFREALSYLDKVKAIPELAGNDDFRKLLTKIDEFKKVSMQIMQAIKLYNL